MANNIFYKAMGENLMVLVIFDCPEAVVMLSLQNTYVL